MNTPIPRSDDTRVRLLDAGLELFGRYGYDGVTTRMLASAARVNQHAIPYHFGGKEGLYLAVAEHVGAEMGRQVKALAAWVETRLGEPGADVAELLVQVMRHLALAAFAPGHQLAWFIFLTREQFQPTAAFETLYQRFTGPGLALVARLAGSLTGGDANSPDTILLAHALAGPLIGFGTARATLQKRLGWSEPEYTPAQMDAILAAIERHCRATVAGLALAPQR